MIFGEHVGFPIGQLLGFAYFLSEYVCVDFLQTFVLYPELCHIVLEFYKGAGVEGSSFVEGCKIVAQGKAHFGGSGFLQQTNDACGDVDVV